MGSSSSFCLLYVSKVLVGNYPTNVYVTYLNHESEICDINILEDRFHGGESRDLNDKVHGISCRYSGRTSKQTYHTFLNTQPIFIKQSAHTS